VTRPVSRRRAIFYEVAAPVKPRLSQGYSAVSLCHCVTVSLRHCGLCLHRWAPGLIPAPFLLLLCLVSMKPEEHHPPKRGGEVLLPGVPSPV